MKFHFCGGHDVPDWLLAEIFTLSKISSVRIKLLSLQAIKNITEGSFEPSALEKIATDYKLDVNDVRACMAALHFIVSNAAKFGVDDVTLKRELMQLGLPREHGDMLCRPYKEQRERITDALRGTSLKLPALRVRDWYVEDLPGARRTSDANMATCQGGETGGAATVTDGGDRGDGAAAHAWVPGLVHLLLSSRSGGGHDASESIMASAGAPNNAGVGVMREPSEGIHLGLREGAANAGAKPPGEGKPSATVAQPDWTQPALRVGEKLMVASVTEDKLRLLIHELKAAYNAMEA